MKSDNQTTRVAIYARVSTDHQQSDLQLNALREYCALRGFQATEYVDEGYSGATQKRPALSRLMADAAHGKVKRVVCWKLDRVARSLKDLIARLEEFGSLGVEFTSITESIDTTTPAGKLLFHIIGAIGEFERSLIRERITAGLAASKERLKRGSYQRKDGHIVKSLGRPQAEIDLTRAAQLRAEGLSWRKVGKALGVSADTVRLRMQQSSSSTAKDQPPVPSPSASPVGQNWKLFPKGFSVNK